MYETLEKSSGYDRALESRGQPIAGLPILIHALEVLSHGRCTLVHFKLQVLCDLRKRDTIMTATVTT